MGEVNLNLLSQYEDDAVKSLVNRNAAVFGRLHQDPPGPSNSSNPATAKMATLLSFASNREETYEGDAYSFVFLPLYDFPSTEKKRLLGVIRVLVQWISYFQDILPDEAKGLIVVLENECDLPYTYQIDGAVVTLLGSGDLHDSRYNYLEEKGTLKQIDKIQETEYGTTLYHGKCPYSVRVYPSALTESMYKSSSPLVMTISVALVFLFTVRQETRWTTPGTGVFSSLSNFSDFHVFCLRSIGGKAPKTYPSFAYVRSQRPSVND